MAYSYHRVGDIEIRGQRQAWIAALFVGAAACAAFTGLPHATQVFADTPPLPSAHVKASTETGHGSATHIGNGLYVTAAHVVTDRATVDINGQQSAVLWANSEYDIALLAGPELAASVPLACITPAVGTEGVAHGNPMDFADIATSGVVAGEARTIEPWKVAIPVDVTMAPGMSGGGFVVGGALAGVNVGVAMAPAAGGFPSYFGISIIVPASVVCDLMGRS